jgi:hypothetical protein
VKEAVLFSAEYKDLLIGALQMDTYEPPTSQVIYGKKLDYQII